MGKNKKHDLRNSHIASIRPCGVAIDRAESFAKENRFLIRLVEKHGFDPGTPALVVTQLDAMADRYSRDMHLLVGYLTKAAKDSGSAELQDALRAIATSLLTYRGPQADRDLRL